MNFASAVQHTRKEHLQMSVYARIVLKQDRPAFPLGLQSHNPLHHLPPDQIICAYPS